MKKQILTLALLFSCILCYSQAPAIHIAKSGKGAPLLLLPGFTTPASVWDETIKNISGTYTYHAVSYAGFNGLVSIKTPWYETIKKELLAYIENESLSGIRIIGHSMGGNLATDLAAAIPGKIKSLVIVDALPCLRELWMPGVPAEQVQYNNSYNKQLLGMSQEAFRQNAIVMAQTMTLQTAKMDTLVKWIEASDRETFVYGYTDLLKLDLRDALKKITAKTLILGAPFPDKNAVISNYEKQYANLTDKTIAIAPESKHFIMFDQPQWFYQKLNTFLSR